MKKKLTALVALAAMLVSLLPTAVFAASEASATKDITISTYGFNNDMSEEEIFIFVQGNDVKAGCRVTCILDGVSAPVYSGVLPKDYENVIKLQKSDVPNLADPAAVIGLNVTVSNATNTEILKTKHFTPDHIGTVPTTVHFGIQDGKGTANRQFIVHFDSNYYPGDNDEVRFQGYDENGNRVGSEQVSKITQSKLADSLNEAGLRGLKTPITLTLNAKTVSVSASFWHNGSEIAKFTNNSLSLAPRYGELKELQLEFPSKEVYRGQVVEGTLWYVNTEGKRYDVTHDAIYVYSDSPFIMDKHNNAPRFTVRDDATVGETLTVTAYYGSDYTKSGKASVKVGVPVSDDGLRLSTYQGKVNEDVRLSLQLIDLKGNSKGMGFVPSAVQASIVEKNGHKIALKNFVVSDFSELKADGHATAVMRSSQACQGNLELVFTNAAGQRYTATSDVFTFGDAAGNNQAVFTIGSTTVKVNGQSKTIDVAPFVQQGRTFVPLRAVNEAMGASVDWNPDKSEITIKDGNKVIVMHPGSRDYTINGVAQKPMDVAPYIGPTTGRTIVPLRFVTEGIGYHVEPVYNPDGTTAQVIISNK